MKMQVLRKMEYKDYRIYVMQFLNVFQYLITDPEKNLYQDHITFPPSFLNKIKYKLHLIPVPYSKAEMEAGEDICLSGAIKSIDALIAGQKNIKKEYEELEKIANTPKNPNSKNKCMWRVVTGENGLPAYQCLNHTNMIVQMADGEKPFHDLVKEEGILSPVQMVDLKK